MALEDVPGQARAKRFLKQLFLRGLVPHALLFSGMPGIGKAALAREFAKLLNCLNPGDAECCDVCASCRKMSGGHHPDFLWVTREGANIKIDQIRALRRRLSHRPFEGHWRVVVIEHAQQLKEEAGNALLKILEEPPHRNIFVLAVPEPQMLLPTIVSRCCHVRFQPLEETWIEDHLVHSVQMPPDQARQVARCAGGSLARARWLAEESRIGGWRELLGRMQALGALPMVDFFPWVAQWVQRSEDLEQDLECIKLWVRDLLCCRLGLDRPTVFDLDEEVRRLVQQARVDDLLLIYDRVEQAVQHLRLNANKQLTLERVCLTIKDGLYGKGHRNSLSQGRHGLSF